MPVTMGPVPGVTSGLRRVSVDPGHFRNGRWFLLAEGVLVSAFGIAGLVSATLHPHAGRTGAPVVGLASTPAHSGILLAFGVAAIAAVGNRRAAVIVTALSAVAYMVLLFFSSVAAARTMPTPLGFHAADIVLHGVLAVINLALLMWLIPDELEGPAWVPRRRPRRGRDRPQPSAEAVAEPAAVSPSRVSATSPGSPPAAAARAQESGAHGSPPLHSLARGQPTHPESTNPLVSVQPARRALLEQSRSHGAKEPSAHDVENSTGVKHLAARATDAARSRGVIVPVAVLAAVVGIVVWIRRR
jgi:hypothetical protein